MAAIGVTESATAGFGLIGKRPVSVLVWGLVRAAFAATTLAFMAPSYFSMLHEFTERASEGVTAPPELSSMMALQSASWLIWLAGLAIGVVLYCAATRAILRPEQSRFAYLRVGAAELFLFLLAFGAMIAFFVAILVLAIPLGIVAAIAVAVHAKAVAVLVAVVGGIAMIGLLIWVLCRLSLVGPMTVEDGKFHLMDAWALTRGHAVDLFVIWICLVVILVLIGLVLDSIMLVAGLMFLNQAAGGLTGLTAFFARPPAELFASLAPGLAIAFVAAIPIVGCTQAIVGAPWARAYRDLVQHGGGTASV